MKRRNPIAQDELRAAEERGDLILGVSNPDPEDAKWCPKCAGKKHAGTCEEARRKSTA